MNLGRFQMYLTLMIDGIGSQPFSATSMPPIEKPEINNQKDILNSSREHFARPKDKVEIEIRDWYLEGEDERFEAEKRKKNKGGGGFGGGGYAGGGGGGYGGGNSGGNFNRNEGQNKEPRVSPIELQPRADMKQALFEAIKTGVATPMENVKVEVKKEPQQVPPRPISFQDVAQKNNPDKREDNKRPTGEKVNALKDALSSLVPKGNQQPINNNQQPKTQNQPPQKPSEPRKTSHQNEIPEDELRKILSID